MGPLSDLILRSLRERLMPLLQRTAEDVVLEVIERKEIPSRTEFQKVLSRTGEQERLLESVRDEIDQLKQNSGPRISRIQVTGDRR